MAQLTTHLGKISGWFPMWWLLINPFLSDDIICDICWILFDHFSSWITVLFLSVKLQLAIFMDRFIFVGCLLMLFTFLLVLFLLLRYHSASYTRASLFHTIICNSTSYLHSSHDGS